MCRKPKNSFILVFVLSFVLLLAGCGGQDAKKSAGTKESPADKFPAKPITIITHTNAGSPTDVMVRQLGKAAEPILGQPVVVENKPGGSGATQVAALVAAPPDGYTLAACTPTQIGSWQSNLKGKFKIDDFAWINRVQIDPYIIVVRADSPWKTLKELVEYAKQNPNKLRVGGYGTVGSGHNVAFNILARTAGIKAAWTPFEGTNDAVTSLLGGHIDVANSNPGQVTQYVQAGKLRILGVMAEKRLPDLPDVPTYAEAGYPVDTSWMQFRGIFGRREIPEPVQNKLSDAFLQAMKSPQFIEYMKSTQQIDGSMGLKEFTAFIQKQDKLTEQWYKELGVTKQQ
ncbi:MAG: tripartite tricarboxylate transporter substrate binding protein [Bacillota bacterium]